MGHGVANVGNGERCQNRRVPATVEVDVERRVAELVEARRSILAELVRQHVDRAIVELLDRELDAARAAGALLALRRRATPPRPHRRR
jgi:hypothetical protein